VTTMSAAAVTSDRATMRDVAGAAGVSLKTVSRVINAERGVAPETVRRVEAAVVALGFRRNDVARNLRKGIELATVGLVIEDLGNPFYAILARAIEEVADRNDHAVIVTSSSEDPGRERTLVGDLLRRGVDGLLIVPAGQDHRYLEPDMRLGTRVVFLDRPPGGIEADAVLLDNVGGARRAVEHLLAHGHRRIAFVGDPQSVPTSAERLQGYRDALERAGLGLDEALVRTGPPRVEAAEAAVRQLLALERPPTAIFAQNNRNCVGVLRALRSVARPVAVLGFDDFELADMLPVPVTVMAHDPGEMGRAGAEILFARLAGDSRPPQRIVIPTRLIARGSGEIAA
jgi:LacI family transcriptional regulator